MHLLFVTNLYPPYVVGGNEMLCDDVVTGAARARAPGSVLCGRGRDLPRPSRRRGRAGARPRSQGGDVPRWAAAFRRRRPFRLHLFSPRSYAGHARGRSARAAARRRRRLEPLHGVAGAARRRAPQRPSPSSCTCATSGSTSGCTTSSRCSRPPCAWKRAALRLARRTRAAAVAAPRAAAPPGGHQRLHEGRSTSRPGIPAEHIDVIHLGVPTGRRSRSCRARRGRPASRCSSSSSARLWEGKGPQTAVRAAGPPDALRSAGPPRRLRLRAGSLRGVSCSGVIAEEGVADHVTLHGRVDRDAVRRLCQSHDVLVFPSQWDEPFAAVPVEAMSSGMAVVATTAGGTPEAIVDGETGLLVPPADPDALARAAAPAGRGRRAARRLGAQSGARRARALRPRGLRRSAGGLLPEAALPPG